MDSPQVKRVLLRPGLCAVGIWAALLVAGGPKVSLAQSEVDSLIQVLRSEAPYMEKLLACKKLGQLGAAEAVPALTPLLFQDERLAHAARIALEAIPDPSAGKALLESLPRLEGLPRVGVIQSLGVRREEAAVGALGKLLAQEDLLAAVAAANALGKIATPEAVSILQERLADSPMPVRKAIANALLEVGENLCQEGQWVSALQLFGKVAEAEVPPHIRLAAQRAAILADKEDWQSRLIRLLRGDRAEFALALEVARLLPPEKVPAILANEVPSQDPERQSLLAELLGELGDPTVLPVVLTVAQTGEKPARVAALKALGRLGDVRAVSLLLKEALHEDSEVALAAREALATLKDPAVDEELVVRLGQSKANTRPAEILLFVELVGRRRIRAAQPFLVTFLEADDTRLRQAAIASLGQILGPEDLEILTERLVRPKAEEDLPSLKEAVRLVCIRAADREKAAEVLVASLPKASLEVKHFLYELLGTVGGQNALNALAEVAFDPQFQDLVTRVLGQWPGPAAAPLLYRIAKEAADQRFRVRALRGYVRIARQFDLPAEQKLAMLRSALSLAERDEERILAVQALSRIHTVEALELATAQLSHEALKPHAAQTILALAERLASSHPEDVRRALEAVLGSVQDPTICKQAETLMQGVPAGKPQR